MPWDRTRTRRVPSWALALVACGLVGCVERRYTIRTDPPGALAIVNGEEVGPTPVSRNFTYYGDRDVTLLLDGHETQRFVQPIRAPWWDNHLTEFFTENLIPITFRDEREYAYKLNVAQNPSNADLMQRAQELRQSGQQPPKPRRRGILAWFGVVE